MELNPNRDPARMHEGLAKAIENVRVSPTVEVRERGREGMRNEAAAGVTKGAKTNGVEEAANDCFDSLWPLTYPFAHHSSTLI